VCVFLFWIIIKSVSLCLRFSNSDDLGLCASLEFVIPGINGPSDKEILLGMKAKKKNVQSSGNN